MTICLSIAGQLSKVQNICPSQAIAKTGEASKRFDTGQKPD
jgi:hypothetical protein